MKIVKLVAENVKRLHVVEITPDGALVTIGGKNGAGKSSVLDSIAYAMGGEKLVPSEPIRSGEAEAKIVVDLGDLIVTRRFRREKVFDCTRVPGTEHEHTDACHFTWGETKSTLTVTNKEGAKYPSPQAVVDRLLGRLTFDPLAFARMDSKPQDETLRRLVGLDFAAVDGRRKDAAAARLMLKKTRDLKEAQLQALPKYDGAPAEEIPIEQINAELARAAECRNLAEEAERAARATEADILTLERGTENVRGEVARVEKQIATLQAQLAEWAPKLDAHLASVETAKRELDAKRITAEAARAVVPDTGAIQTRLTETQTMNAKVRANQRRAEAQKEIDGLAADVDARTADIEAADREKKDALAAAPFPVPGLGLSDDGVTFNGLPFDQAGSAEQVRVSVAIGIALNPKLRVLLIRNGNLLDDDSLAAVAAQAEAADMQIWCEYVSEDAEGVSVFIEDGHVSTLEG